MQEYKCFSFKAVALTNIEGYVWAKDKGEAYDLIMRRAWEEVTYEKIEEVEDIENLEEEE